METTRTAGDALGAPDPLPPLAALLRQYRAAAALTQEELAERSGISVRAISDLERGAKSRPQRATVDLLARGLGLNDDERVVLERSVPGRNRPSGHATRLLDLPVGGFLGSVPPAPLVARSVEIERVREVVAAVASGEGRLLLLSGEPGVGKTRLAQEATMICRASGMYVMTGRCYEAQQALAYYPFLEILSRLVAVVRSRLGFDPVQRWAQLGALIPDESGGASASPLRGDGDLLRLFCAVTGLLEALAAQMPIAVALDDLHWADRSSLGLLQHLAGHLRHVPVLLLGTYRDSDVDRQHPLNALLRDSRREHLSDEIAVERLNEAGTGALMAATLEEGTISPHFASVVHHQAEGNAFFVQEVTRDLEERGDAALRDGIWECASRETVVPRTVHEAIAERVGRLSVPTQSLLGEASVLGQTFDFDELSGMASLAEEAVEDGLNEAIAASVVRVEDENTYTFNHALTQEVLYRELTPRRRKRLHLSAGRVIEGRPLPIRDKRVAELARHFHAGGDWRKAAAFAALAGDQAENRFAHHEAERHYRATLGYAGALEEDREAAIREKLGRVLTNAGSFPEARGELGRSVALYRQLNDIDGEIRTVVQLASVHTATGTCEEGIGQVEDILGRLAQHARPEDVTELWIVLETLYFSLGRFIEGLGAADRAVALTEKTGNAAAFARALTGRGSDLLALGRWDEGLAALEHVIDLADEANDPYNLVRAMGNAAIVYMHKGNLARSRQLMEQSVAMQDRIRVPWGQALHICGLGLIERVMGNWDQALQHMEEAERIFRSGPPSSWAIYPYLDLGELYLALGRREQGLGLIDGALTLARVAEDSSVGRIERVLAELDIVDGHAAKARARLEKVLAGCSLEAAHITEITIALASAHLALGDLVRAGEAIEDAISRSTRAGHALALTDALRVRANVRAAEHMWEASKQDFAHALRVARDMPNPFSEARCLLDEGRMWARRGDGARGRSRVREALEVFRRLGAWPYIERAEQALEEMS